MKSVLNGITTIIFDLGGVVLNLDPHRSAKSFAKLSGKDVSEIYNIFVNNQWVLDFECGKISADQFRNQVRLALNVDLSETTIDEAWNAMLLDIPAERLELLSGLRNDYNTLVLSNTNEIHIETFDNIVAAVSGTEKIQNHFDKVYYSNELGMRKPDHEIFEFVINSNNLDPTSTLFIDDMLPNIESAKQCKLKTVHLTDQTDLFRIFN